MLSKIEKVSKGQAIGLLIGLGLLLWSILYVAVYNGYHSGEYTTGYSKITDSSLQKPLDRLVLNFYAETAYLDQVNVYLTDVAKDISGDIRIELVHDDTIIYSGNQALADIPSDKWFSIHLGIRTVVGDQYIVSIASTDTEQQPKLYWSEDGTDPALTLTYLQDLPVQDKGLILLYRVVLFSVYAVIILRYRSILRFLRSLKDQCLLRGWKLGPYAILNTLIAILALYGSKVEIPDAVFLIAFILLVLFAGMWLENRGHSFAEEYIRERKHKAALVLLSFYASFSLVGSRCFIYPINMHISPAGLLCFIAMAAALFPVVSLAVRLLGHRHQSDMSTKEQMTTKKNMSWKLYLLCSGMLLLAAVYFMRAFHPAISSPDTQYCMHFAVNSIRGITDWHPPFYILWLKGILRIWNSTYAILLVQYIWFSFVFMEGMRLLYRRGMSSGAIGCITALSAVNSGNMIHLTTIWKDIPYAISVFWLTILLARFVLEDQTKKGWIYIELILALLCVCLMRQNGIVVFLTVIPILLVSFRKSKKLWLACAASAALVLLIRLPLYSYLDIQKEPGGGQYIGLGQDIMAAYYNGGELSDDALHIVNVLSKENMTEFEYSPYWAKSSYDLEIPLKDFISAYIDTFMKNPVLMTRGIICRQDGIWNLLMGEDGTLGYVNYTGTRDGQKQWNAIVPKRQPNFMTERVSELTARSVQSSLLNMTVWRAGIWTLLTVCAMTVCMVWKRKKRYWILFSVQLAHILSLVLSTGWSDYRYYWPLTLIGLFLILLVRTIPAKETNVFVSEVTE